MQVFLSAWLWAAFLPQKCQCNLFNLQSESYHEPSGNSKSLTQARTGLRSRSKLFLGNPSHLVCMAYCGGQSAPDSECTRSKRAGPAPFWCSSPNRTTHSETVNGPALSRNVLECRNGEGIHNARTPGSARMGLHLRQRAGFRWFLHMR